MCIRDSFRRDHGGAGTYDRLEGVPALPLATRPYAPVMMTVSPETAAEYAQGVKELWQKGFHYFICSLNYAGNWTKESVRELRRQYRELADFYYELTKMCIRDRYYENGQLQIDMSYSDGVPSGPYKFYYPNGQIAVDGVLENGSYRSDTKMYDEDGISITEIP